MRANASSSTALRWCLATALIGGLLLAGCARDGGKDDKNSANEAQLPVPVEVEAAFRRAISASYTGTAPLEPRSEAQVIAKTSGVALDVLVEEGDQVSAGQTLVRLDSSRAQLQAAQSAAAMHNLEAKFRRAQQLAAQQMISAADHDQLLYDLENARATNRLANLELSYAQVRAPIAGVIAARSIKTGNFVQINTPIFRIVDISRLEATLNVPERELATLKAGQTVKLQVDALPGKTFLGVVDRVAPVVDAGSGTFRVIAAFDRSDDTQPGQLQPGMFGRIRIDYDLRPDALVIPRVALIDAETDSAVYTVNDGKATRKAIKLGHSDGAYVEVIEGLEAGEKVVTAGKTALRDGGAVQVLSP